MPYLHVAIDMGKGDDIQIILDGQHITHPAS